VAFFLLFFIIVIVFVSTCRNMPLLFSHFKRHYNEKDIVITKQKTPFFFHFGAAAVVEIHIRWLLFASF